MVTLSRVKVENNKPINKEMEQKKEIEIDVKYFPGDSGGHYIVRGQMITYDVAEDLFNYFNEKIRMVHPDFIEYHRGVNWNKKITN